MHTCYCIHLSYSPALILIQNGCYFSMYLTAATRQSPTNWLLLALQQHRAGHCAWANLDKFWKNLFTEKIIQVASSAETRANWHWSFRREWSTSKNSIYISSQVPLIEQCLTSHWTHYMSYRGRDLWSNDPTNSVKALKEGPKDQASIPPGPPHLVTIILHTMNTKVSKYTYTKMNLGTVKWAQWDKNPIQRPVKLFKKLCNYIMLHNTTYR